MVRSLRSRMWLGALALVLAWSAPAAQDTCGGIGGGACPPGEFCQFPPGECCCDTQGMCRPIPDACPAVCDPVCGCDGRTYRNECEAASAGVSVDHVGVCPDVGEQVAAVRFGTRTQMVWNAVPSALAYNLYRKVLVTRPPEDFGDCLYGGMESNNTTIPGAPAPGRLWLFQVTAVFESGEGPMGIGSTCVPRRPAAPCVCTLPAEIGPCGAAIPRWFHNIQTRQCEPFFWGGCGGNANNFETQEACEQACTDTCVLPPETGACAAAFPRWFFSPDLGRCAPFVWGGCGGNSNNFPGFAECQEACVCSLPADVGPCDGTVPRWYHEAATSQCTPFIWGGCEGNFNNFATEIMCEQACESVCDLPPDVGPCDGVVPRWFHNAETGECEEFIWGGCDGNANNFPTRAECEAHCG